MLIISSYILLLLNCNFSSAHEVVTNWDIDRELEQIQFSYRYLIIGDTLKTRQMRVTFFIDAESQELVSMFKNPEVLKLWTARAQKCEIVHHDEYSWTTYSLFTFPWPFQQRDLITDYHLVEKDSCIDLILTGAPSKLPLVKDITRMAYYEGQWSFVTQENGIIKAEFTSITFQEPQFPRFIQDPIIQSVFIDSISKFKTVLKSRENSNEYACKQVNLN